jgi:hypothetical protein
VLQRIGERSQPLSDIAAMILHACLEVKFCKDFCAVEMSHAVVAREHALLQEPAKSMRWTLGSVELFTSLVQYSLPVINSQ